MALTGRTASFPPILCRIVAASVVATEERASWELPLGSTFIAALKMNPITESRGEIHLIYSIANVKRDFLACCANKRERRVAANAVTMVAPAWKRAIPMVAPTTTATARLQTQTMEISVLLESFVSTSPQVTAQKSRTKMEDSFVSMEALARANRTYGTNVFLGCLSHTIVIYENRHLGCHCQPGYVGPLCEFEDNGDPPLECSLSCENHGICRKGAKDVSILEKYGLHHRRHLQQAYDENFEHCVCPRGYVGLQCEFQLDLCPGGAHACLNGGECVTVAQGTEVRYACNCGDAETETARFAGESCEMESTEFCTIDGGKSVQGAGINSFCTNGGRCLDKVPYNEP